SSGILVPFSLQGGGFADLLAGMKVQRWLEHVVVVQRDFGFAGADLGDEVPSSRRIAVQAGVVVIGNLTDGRRRVAVIPKDHRVTIVALLEGEINAFLLQQSADESPLGFVVLNAIGAFGISLGAIPMKHFPVELGVSEQLLDDL